MSEPIKYVDEKWTRIGVDQVFDQLEPAIIAALEKAGQTDAADDFRKIVVPQMTANIRGNLSTFLTPMINSAIQQCLNATATMKGERTVVTKHDAEGRIVETMKVPLWATVQVPS